MLMIQFHRKIGYFISIEWYKTPKEPSSTENSWSTKRTQKFGSKMVFQRYVFCWCSFANGSPYCTQIVVATSLSVFIIHVLSQRNNKNCIHFTVPNGNQLRFNDMYVIIQQHGKSCSFSISPFSKSIIGLKKHWYSRSVGVWKHRLDDFIQTELFQQKTRLIINFHVVYIRKMPFTIQSEMNPIFGPFCDFFLLLL